MRHFKREAVQWLNMAHEARITAREKNDQFSEPALQVADLCEHIAAALERISDIVDSVNGCTCGQCPKPIPQPLH